ncbi:MAG: cellulase family glycosylhydrolase [Chloroflexota bacterium]
MRSKSPIQWIGWAICILLIFRALQPAPDLVTLGPAQTVETTLPVLAVHTRLTDEVEEWKIKRSLELVREMGATTIVEFFPWAYYQSENREVAWSHPDLVIEHANQQGLKVIARIGLTPGWARPEETTLNYLDQDHYADFAAFSAAFAERYEGKLHAIIVWNEPNLAFEWGYQPTTAADYTNLLKQSYNAIKAADPNVLVLGGALAPTLEPKGSQWGLNDLIFLEEMYQAGAADSMDGLAVHTYGFKFPPETDPAPDLLNFRRYELYRDIMLAYGDNNPVYITETGWNDHPRWTRAVRPGQRIDYTLLAMEHIQNNTAWVETAAIWMFRTPAPTKSYMDSYTLVTPEFIEKPIYTALKERSRGN